MPATLFGHKVPHDLWLEVKHQAAEEGHSDNWQYIMSILKKRMGLGSRKRVKKSLPESLDRLKFQSFFETGTMTRVVKNEEHQNFNYVNPVYRKYRVGTKIVGPFTGAVYRIASNGGIVQLKPKRKKNMGIRDVIKKAKQSLRYGWDTARYGGDTIRTISGSRGNFVVAKFEGKRRKVYGGFTKPMISGLPEKERIKHNVGSRGGRKLYRELGFSKKSLSKSEEISIDQTLSKIRDAFSKQFNPPSNSIAPSSVNEADRKYYNIDSNGIYPTYVIARDGYSNGAGYFKASYKIGEDGAVTFGELKKVKMVFKVTKAGEIVGMSFQKAGLKSWFGRTEKSLSKAEKQGLRFGWDSHRSISGGGRIFGIRGRQGYFQIKTGDGRVSGHRNRSVAGRRDDVWEHVASGKKGVARRRKLYRKLGLSTKSLVKAKKNESSVPTSYDAISSSTGYSH